MGNYRIVCDNQSPIDAPKQHSHVVEVGIGTTPRQWSRILSLATVLAMVDRGDTFYTVSSSSGKTARVLPVNCTVCGHRVIRSTADKSADNNLDNLPDCAK
jgi:hypothetical protein